MSTDKKKTEKSFEITFGKHGIESVLFDGKDITKDVLSIDVSGEFNAIPHVNLCLRVSSTVRIIIGDDVRIVGGYRYDG